MLYGLDLQVNKVKCKCQNYIIINSIFSCKILVGKRYELVIDKLQSINQITITTKFKESISVASHFQAFFCICAFTFTEKPIKSYV